VTKSLVINLFDYTRYDQYLDAILSSEAYGHGSRKRLADFIGVQNSFISLILTQKAQLTPELAVKVAQFLKLNAEETEFFLLLVQSDRTGSVELKKHFDIQKERILKKRSKIKNRIHTNESVTAEDQLTYYSHAFYSMIHILCSLPEYNTQEMICKTLKIEKTEARKYLDFLLARGFIEKDKDHFKTGKLRIHLPSGSPALAQHHANYRVQTIQRLGNIAPKDLHYSGILGMTAKDRDRVRELTLQYVESIEKILATSKPEVPVILNLDWFGI
jgi:uncharacterized protein (TIGR02147 family)